MGDQEVGHAVRELITAWLAWHEQLDRHERTTELSDRVAGYRVVSGCQTGAGGSWEITDAENGELLASGVGIDSFHAAWQESWTHEDAIGRDANAATPDPAEDFGLPAGLAGALREWVVDHPDEARAILSE